MVAARHLAQRGHLVALDPGDPAEYSNRGNIRAGQLSMPGVQDRRHVIARLLHAHLNSESVTTVLTAGIETGQTAICQLDISGGPRATQYA